MRSFARPTSRRRARSVASTRRKAARTALLAAAITIAAWLPGGKARACANFLAAPSSRWSLAVRDGASWLITPCSDRFFSLGVNVLDGGYAEREKGGKVWYSWKAFAPSLTDWTAETRLRLFAWGFNSAGGWALPPETLKLPTIVNLELGRRARFHWFDPFDPETEARMNAVARELVRPYRGSPYRIGYFSDNEVGWPTPTGTPCPSLPQVPIPSSRRRSLPIIVILVSASGPLPIKVAPLTAGPTLPSSMR